MLVTNALSQDVTVLAFALSPLHSNQLGYLSNLLSTNLTCYIVYCSYYKRKNLSQINEKGLVCLLSRINGSLFIVSLLFLAI